MKKTMMTARSEFNRLVTKQLIIYVLMTPVVSMVLCRWLVCCWP